jgi:hypothetical protein
MIKQLANDLNKLVLVQVITQDPFNKDKMLNNILALMFYHNFISYQGITSSIQNLMFDNFNIPFGVSEDILKTVIIMIATQLLSGQLINWYSILITLVGVFVYHYIIRPIIIDSEVSKRFDFATVEDLCETIILLGISNTPPSEIVYRILALLIYHNLVVIS